LRSGQRTSSTLTDEVAVTPFNVENSYIKLPTTPGLGLELKEEELAKHPYREFPPRALRQARDEGP
jgi:L-alanine-DL-glutamate epimerase-like enolase superfamily enzyme